VPPVAGNELAILVDHQPLHFAEIAVRGANLVDLLLRMQFGIALIGRIRSIGQVSSRTRNVSVRGPVASAGAGSVFFLRDALAAIRTTRPFRLLAAGASSAA
jgi:hypothetical protein